MLDKGLVERALGLALGGGGDFAELFAERNTRNQLQFSSDRLEKSISGTDSGAGIRVFRGHQSYYGYTNDLSPAGIEGAARALTEAVSRGDGKRAVPLQRRETGDIHPVDVPPDAVPPDQKLSLVERAARASRRAHSSISQVEVGYMDEAQHVFIANSEGLLVEDRRVRTRLSLVAVASSGNEMQVGRMSPGAMMGFEFYQRIDLEELACRAAETAVTMLSAEYAPAGTMPVVIHNGFGGVIFHEACGHSLEAYSVSQEASIFAHKIGSPIASEVVTAVDDGSLPNAWGSTNVDDEGTPTQRTVLIEKGVLKSFMVDRLSGLKLGLASTGSGRRQSYRFPPVSRMRNTMILAGESSFEEIIAGTDYGLFAKKMGGGSVNPSTGDFNFAVEEGYLIRKGKIEKPVRGATLIGNGAQVLKDIDMVGDNLDLAQGVCGASSGWVPTNVGQPTIRVKSLVVGGREP